MLEITCCWIEMEYLLIKMDQQSGCWWRNRGFIEPTFRNREILRENCKIVENFWDISHVRQLNKLSKYEPISLDQEALDETRNLGMSCHVRQLKSLLNYEQIFLAYLPNFNEKGNPTRGSFSFLKSTPVQAINPIKKRPWNTEKNCHKTHHKSIHINKKNLFPVFPIRV